MFYHLLKGMILTMEERNVRVVAVKIRYDQPESDYIINISC